MTTEIVMRTAKKGDLDTLLALEARVFSSDRLSRRSLRRLIGRRTASILVAEKDKTIIGYTLILYRRDTALARLYSIAVSPETQGSGLGRALLAKAEDDAFRNGCIFLRLEVRADNAPAIALYHKTGYRQFGFYLDYYTDHTDALRFEKRLTGKPTSNRDHPPYYRQTTDFTCGPACMIMTLTWFDRKTKPSRRLELRLWREATTIFMTSGLGGCEPFGMAVALAKRGLKPEIYSSRKHFFFLPGVRSKNKKDVMRVVQEDFRERAEEMGIPTHAKAITRRELAAAIENGGLAIVLVSGYQMFRDPEEHWIVVHDQDDHHVYVHDPWVEDKVMETPMAAAGLPIPWPAFERMVRIGTERRAAAIIVNGDGKA